MIYDYKLKLLNKEVVDKKPFLCLCPYDQESDSVRKKLFGDLPIPSLMKDRRNNLTMRRDIYSSSICSEDAMCIDYFCQHIDETIEDHFCLDHLAIKCYLLAVHDPYLSLKIFFLLKQERIFSISTILSTWIRRSRNKIICYILMFPMMLLSNNTDKHL